MRTTFPVAAPPGAWTALADPDRLAAALPGCRSVSRAAGGAGAGDGDGDGGGTLRVTADVAVASVRGLWAGTVEPAGPDAVRVRGAGAPGRVDLVVRADPGRTALTVEGEVAGPLATVGGAVLAAAVRRLAEDLLAALAVPAPPPTRAPAPPAPAEPPGGPRPGSRRRRAWIGGAAGAAALAAGAGVVRGIRRSGGKSG